MRIRLNALPFFNNMLLVRLNDEVVVSYEKNEQYTILFNKEKEIIGYQIENFDDTLSGHVEANDVILSKINQIVNTTLEHDYFSYLVVGKVVKVEPHPHSNHLKVCQVDIGTSIIQIVCGATNVRVDLIGVVALENAIIQGEIIKSSTLLKIKTDGMLCSAYELGLIKEKKKGLLELDESYVIGEEFKVKGELKNV